MLRQRALHAGAEPGVNSTGSEGTFPRLSSCDTGIRAAGAVAHRGGGVAKISYCPWLASGMRPTSEPQLHFSVSAAHDLAKPAAVPCAAAPASEPWVALAAPTVRYHWRLRCIIVWSPGRRALGASRQDTSSGTWCPRRRSQWRRPSARCRHRRGRGRRNGAWCRRRRRGRRRRGLVSIAAPSVGRIPWRSAPRRDGFIRLQLLLPLNWGVGLRPVLPVKTFGCRASCVRIGGERAALARACRRCCRCGARGRGPEHTRAVKRNVP